MWGGTRSYLASSASYNTFIIFFDIQRTVKENKTHSKKLKEEFGRALMSTLLPEVPTGNSGVNDITSMFELY